MADKPDAALQGLRRGCAVGRMAGAVAPLGAMRLFPAGSRWNTLARLDDVS